MHPAETLHWRRPLVPAAPTDVGPCRRTFDLEPDEDVGLDDFAAFEAALTGPQ